MSAFFKRRTERRSVDAAELARRRTRVVTPWRSGALRLRVETTRPTFDARANRRLQNDGSRETAGHARVSHASAGGVRKITRSRTPLSTES